jgi:hypothetical protein
MFLVHSKKNKKQLKFYQLRIPSNFVNVKIFGIKKKNYFLINKQWLIKKKWYLFFTKDPKKK